MNGWPFGGNPRSIRRKTTSRRGHGPTRQEKEAGAARPHTRLAAERARRDLRPALVGRRPRGRRRPAAAGGRHALLRQPDPRPRRAARRPRRRLGHHGRRLRADLRLARPAARRRPRRRGLAAPDQRDHRHRGPPVLPPLRRRRAGHAAGAHGEPPGRGDRAGRLVGHPAGGQARLLRQQPHPRAQDQGGAGGAGARDEVLQGRDPLDLPQPRLPRRRRHRLRGRRRALLRQVRRRRDPRRGGDARGPPARALALRPDQRPRARPVPRRDHRRADGEPGLPDRGAGRRGARRPRRALGRRGGARRRRLRRLGDVLGPGLPDPQDHRGRRGADHLRPAAAARRRGRPRRGLRGEGQGRLQRPGRDRRHVAGRRGAGDGGGARLRRRRGPVQPRHPGAAPDRVAVQDLRLRRGAAGRHEPARPRARRAAQHLRPRLRRVGAAELHPRVSRRDHADAGAGEVGEHRHGAGRRGDRAAPGWRRSRRTSVSPGRSPRVRRWRSASPRRRSSR